MSLLPGLETDENTIDFLPIPDITSTNSIQINILTKKDCVIVYANVAGIEKENIKIELIDKTLKIKAERFIENDKGYHIDEIIEGSLTRLIPINFSIKVEEIKASLNNGLLKIVLPIVIPPNVEISIG